MLEFEDSARSEAPPEEVWTIVYDPARFTEWWEGMQTTSVGDGEFTLQHVDFPELQIPNRLEVRDAGSAVVISCLLRPGDPNLGPRGDSRREGRALRAIPASDDGRLGEAARRGRR
jgi:hypothetical protein